MAGQIAPEFFTRAGDLRQLPASFVEAVHSVVSAANCQKCVHPHLLVAPKTTTVAAGERAVGSRASEQGPDTPTSKDDAGATEQIPQVSRQWFDRSAGKWV